MKRWRITAATPATLVTIWDRTGTTRLTRLGQPAGARLLSEHFRPTAMVYTIWQGISLSGAGIGMERPMVNLLRLIQQGRLRATAACAEAATGRSSPPLRVARIGPAPTRAAAVVLASGLCCPQVSHEQRSERSGPEQARRSEGPRRRKGAAAVGGRASQRGLPAERQRSVGVEPNLRKWRKRKPAQRSN